MKHEKLKTNNARKPSRGKPVYWELLGSVLGAAGVVGKRDREPGSERGGAVDCSTELPWKKSNFGNVEEKGK